MSGAELVDFTHYNRNRSYPFLSTYCAPCTVFTDFIHEQGALSVEYLLPAMFCRG